MRKLISFLVVIILGITLIPIIPVQVTKAAGMGTAVLTPSSTLGFYSPADTWPEVCHADTASSSSGGAGYIASGEYNKWRTYSMAFQFNLGSLPFDTQEIGESVEIVGCRLKFTPTQLNVYGTPSGWVRPYMSFYDTDAGLGGTLDATDIDEFNDGQQKFRVSSVCHWDQMVVDQEYTLYCTSAQAARILQGETYDPYKSVIHFVTEQHALDWQFFNNWASGGPGYRMALSGTVKLEVDYAAEAVEPDYEWPTNGGIDTSVLGDETIDSITMVTPRCLYGNEDIGFTVTGDSGANISLELVTDTGEVIDEIQDAVRLDNYYHWRSDALTSDFSGFVRCREINHGLTSPWTAVRPVYSSSEANLMTYAESTEYPQYSEPFSDYVVNEGDLMAVHWKTNIDCTSEGNDYELKIYSNGDNVTPLYSENFTALMENYFTGTAYNRQHSAHWRFALFTPRAIEGQDDYGGLVNNLNLPFAPENKGFLQSIITDNGTDTELTTTHSAHWYVTNADGGISVKIDDRAVVPGGALAVDVNLAKECQADEFLNQMKAEIIGGTDIVYSALSQGENSFTISAPTKIGDFYVRVTLYAGGGAHSYEYVYQIPFEVTASGKPSSPTSGGSTDPSDVAEGLLGRMLDTARNLGVDPDTDSGGMLLIVIGCIVLFVLFFQSKILRVIMPLVWIVIGIWAEWMPIGLVIMVAFGVGFFIFKILTGRKGVEG